MRMLPASSSWYLFTSDMFQKTPWYSLENWVPVPLLDTLSTFRKSGKCFTCSLPHTKMTSSRVNWVRGWAIVAQSLHYRPVVTCQGQKTLNFLLVTQGRPSSQFLFLITLRGHVISIHDMTQKLQLLLQELLFIHLKLHLLVSVSWRLLPDALNDPSYCCYPWWCHPYTTSRICS